MSLVGEGPFPANGCGIVQDRVESDGGERVIKSYPLRGGGYGNLLNFWTIVIRIKIPERSFGVCYGLRIQEVK